MKVRAFIRSITPPLLLRFYRSVIAPTWEGVCPHFKNVAVKGDGIRNGSIVNETLAATKSLLGLSKRYGTIPTEVVGEHLLLPLVCSLVSKRNGKIRVLDVGGGMGVAYIHLLNSLTRPCAIDYHVVEQKRMSEEGAHLFENDGQIHFHTEIPAHLSEIDVVYMSSVLQYIEDYRGFLKSLCAKKAKYFLFVKLSAGDFPTYATLQRNMPGIRIPYWFIDVKEILEIMTANGYSLMFKGALEEEYNQRNFPEQYRMGRTCNLLFSLNSSDEF